MLMLLWSFGGSSFIIVLRGWAGLSARPDMVGDLRRGRKGLDEMPFRGGSRVSGHDVGDGVFYFAVPDHRGAPKALPGHSGPDAMDDKMDVYCGSGA